MIEKCKFCKRFIEAKIYMRDPIVSSAGKKIVDRRNCLMKKEYVTSDDGCENIILSNNVWCKKRNQWMARVACTKRWISNKEQECKRCDAGKELVALVRKVGTKKRKRKLLIRKKQ